LQSRGLGEDAESDLLVAAAGQQVAGDVEVDLEVIGERVGAQAAVSGLEQPLQAPAVDRERALVELVGRAADLLGIADDIAVRGSSLPSNR
jgi:hypothetical protein